MKRKNDDLHGTNFEFLKGAFPDLIDSIEDGFSAMSLVRDPLCVKR